MPNSKLRCSVCRDYYPREDMLRVGVGALGAICEDECMVLFKEKYRKKRDRRVVNRQRRYGRRLPGACRDRVRRRDNARCRWCGAVDELNIHHVRYRSEGGPDNQRNLMTLC